MVANILFVFLRKSHGRRIDGVVADGPLDFLIFLREAAEGTIASKYPILKKLGLSDALKLQVDLGKLLERIIEVPLSNDGCNVDISQKIEVPKSRVPVIIFNLDEVQVCS